MEVCAVENSKKVWQNAEIFSVFLLTERALPFKIELLRQGGSMSIFWLQAGSRCNNKFDILRKEENYAYF